MTSPIERLRLSKFGRLTLSLQSCVFTADGMELTMARSEVGMPLPVEQAGRRFSGSANGTEDWSFWRLPLPHNNLERTSSYPFFAH